MKKIVTFFLALAMMLVLVACDELPFPLSSLGGDKTDDAPVTAPADLDSKLPDLDADLEELFPDEEEPESETSDPSADYYLGDVISTVFFDYVINDAMACKTYGDYTATEGNQLVVITVNIRNTETYSMPMGQQDFQIQWGTGDTDFGYPLGNYYHEQLPDEYDIPIGGIEEGKLVYEVPADCKDFSVSYLEYFQDESEGNAYFTYFTAENDATAA